MVETGMDGLFGRRELLTPVEEITRGNLLEVLGRACCAHRDNSREIDYLYQYMKGRQPILSREKKIRREINNRVVENHASEIAQFTSGYFLGEPVTYVRRGENESASAEIGALNDYMFVGDKASHDKALADWMAICGVGYRMVRPGQGWEDSPFELDTPDPRHTFVVYHSGFGRRRMLGVREVRRGLDGGKEELRFCGYTRDHYFEVVDNVVEKWEPHILGDIPIFEYRLNMARMGSFEPALPLLDAINTVASNRVDSVEQFVQAFWKFIGCSLDKEKFEEFKQLGAIMVPPGDSGGTVDVDLIVREMNQEQTQTLVDYLYDQALVICGMPTTTKGGASTSDTGAAVFLRDGWSQCEARARDTELLFKKSEREFLRMVLKIIRDTREFGLSLAEIECKFTRRQHDNLLSKTQALLHMLEAGLEPGAAIATCGLFNDPMDVAKQSERYLIKWEPDYLLSPVQPYSPQRADSDDKSPEIAAVEKPL